MTDMTAGYDEFCNFLEKHSGICLGASKQYLVSSRLRRLMADNEFKSLNELVNKIQLASHGKLKTQVIDLLGLQQVYVSSRQDNCHVHYR